MKYFCTLLQESREWDIKNHCFSDKTYVGDCLGTFATIRLDGRNTLENMIIESKKLQAREKNTTGFRIYRCETIGRNEKNIYVFKN